MAPSSIQDLQGSYYTIHEVYHAPIVQEEAQGTVRLSEFIADS